MARTRYAHQRTKVCAILWYWFLWYNTVSMCNSTYHLESQAWGFRMIPKSPGYGHSKPGGECSSNHGFLMDAKGILSQIRTHKHHFDWENEETCLSQKTMKNAVFHLFPFPHCWTGYGANCVSQSFTVALCLANSACGEMKKIRKIVQYINFRLFLYRIDELVAENCGENPKFLIF